MLGEALTLGEGDHLSQDESRGLPVAEDQLQLRAGTEELADFQQESRGAEQRLAFVQKAPPKPPVTMLRVQKIQGPNARFSVRAASMRTLATSHWSSRRHV